MASKKESEAFSLLQSMYQDDDDDMEDAESSDEEQPPTRDDSRPASDDVVLGQQGEGEGGGGGGGEEDEPRGAPEIRGGESIPGDDVVLPSASAAPMAAAAVSFSTLRPPTPQSEGGSRREKMSIVDYGHDDVAMSPEPEEGEILGTSTGRVMIGEELGGINDFPEKAPTVSEQMMTPNNQMGSPWPSAQIDVPETDKDTMKESEAEVTEDVTTIGHDRNDFDPFDMFLPPSPEEKCSDALQEKINKFLAYKRQGRSFNVEVRNRKDYRNPDFLTHAVRYQDIDEFGSNFNEDVFNPHGYDAKDFYDEIEVGMKLEMERKEQERKKSQKVDFVSGGTQSGVVASAQKVTLPSPGVPNLPSGGLTSGSTNISVREGRHNKKSKWDKVDGDRSLLSGGQDTVSAVGAHAALLSAANAGAGYVIFAQQKRREAEEKRSSDKKVDRRS